MGVKLTPAQVLELLPQQEPFRFVDEILEVSEDHIDIERQDASSCSWQ